MNPATQELSQRTLVVILRLALRLAPQMEKASQSPHNQSNSNHTRSFMQMLLIQEHIRSMVLVQPMIIVTLPLSGLEILTTSISSARSGRTCSMEEVAMTFYTALKGMIR